MRFIDGLHEDLQAPVLIQRLSSLDTAFVLARLQEEVAAPSKRREFRELDYAPKSGPSNYWPLPPPPRPDKAGGAYSKDRRSTEAA